MVKVRMKDGTEVEINAYRCHSADQRWSKLLNCLFVDHMGYPPGIPYPDTYVAHQIVKRFGGAITQAESVATLVKGRVY